MGPKAVFGIAVMLLIAHGHCNAQAQNQTYNQAQNQAQNQTYAQTQNQEEQTNFIWQDELQQYLDDGPNDEANESAWQSVFEDLQSLQASPLNLNTATEEQLSQIPFITSLQAEAIVKYIKQYGDMQTVHELRLVPRMDAHSIELLLPFVSVAPAPTHGNFWGRQQHVCTLSANRTLNTREGYKHQDIEHQKNNKAYLGDAWRETLRYKYTNGQHIASGFVLDKDAGEDYRHRFPWSDSFNAFVQLKDYRSIRNLIVGHYRVRLGCGLLINQQFSLGKSLQATNFTSQTTRLSPHSSSDEYNFLQGAALDYRLNSHWQILLLGSVRELDGKVERDTLTSILTDGSHKLLRDENKRHACFLTTYGLHVGYSNHWLQLGINGLANHLQKTYYRPMRLYNENYFRGHQLLQTSLDYRLRYLRFILNGEIAMSDNGSVAAVHALQRSFCDTWNMTLIHRYYARSYTQLWASSFAESSDMQAEHGLYIRAIWNPRPHWQWQASADVFHFSHAKYGIDRPSDGYELQSALQYERRHLHIVARYRIQKKDCNRSDDDPMSDMTSTTNRKDLTSYLRQSADLTSTWQCCNWLQLRNRVLYRTYSEKATGDVSQGFCVSQAALIRFSNCPLSANIQGAWFNTDDYDSRLYLNEYNLLYSFNVPMVYGTGIRYTASLQWKPTRHIGLEAKYAMVSYKNKSHISSDLQKIDGNRQHDIFMTLQWRF